VSRFGAGLTGVPLGRGFSIVIPGSRLQPVIGPRFARPRWRRPRNDDPDIAAVIASASEAIQAVSAAAGWIASSRCSSQLNLHSNDGGETLHPGHAQTARRAHFLLRRRANQNHPPARPAPDKEGRFAIVTNVGSGMRWPQCRSRRMPIFRTAKSCGPGAPRLALSFAR
jgi:hypothetical protein